MGGSGCGVGGRVGRDWGLKRVRQSPRMGLVAGGSSRRCDRSFAAAPLVLLQAVLCEFLYYGATPLSPWHL